MDYHQENLLAQQFLKLEETLNPFAFDVLKCIYTNSKNGINIRGIYHALGNKNLVLIRKSIAEMEKLNLIQINKDKCERTEKKYFITKSGKDIILKFYSYNF